MERLDVRRCRCCCCCCCSKIGERRRSVSLSSRSYRKAGVSRRESGDSESRSIGLSGDSDNGDDNSDGSDNDNGRGDGDVTAGIVVSFFPLVALVVAVVEPPCEKRRGDIAIRSLVDDTKVASGMELCGLGEPSEESL